jgi:hypothetical protein
MSIEIGRLAMIRRIAVVLAVLLGLVLLGGIAEAGQRGARTPRVRLFQSPPPATRPLYDQESYQLRQPNPYSYWREIYPQFYGGFHYRQIYEFGPPGDFGFRGSPW